MIRLLDTPSPGRQTLDKMLRLMTFGGLALEPNGSPVAPRVRPPRLALLAVLAATGDRGVTRERLVALFWPEADEERGRHSLRQAVYALKNEAGQDVVHAGPSLLLNSQALTSDIEEFRIALARGDRRRAVELYRGPFLDGFYLSGSAEFERWVEQERTRLAEAAATALLELTGEAAAGGRNDESARWWQQLTLLEPLSARFVLGYARALVASGDRPQALAVIRAHSSLVRQELEVEPDPELKRLELQIRSQPDAPRRPAAEDSADPARLPAPALDPAPTVATNRRFRRRTAAIAVSTLTLLAALGTRQVLSKPAEPVASVLDHPYTPSAVAARFYEEGLRAFRVRDLPATRRMMRAALQEDSTFAMAAYLLALALEEPELESRSRALQLARSAPERERLTIMTDFLASDQDPLALSIAEEAAAKYPNETRILLALGSARSYAGDWAGAVEACERVIALNHTPDPASRDNCQACDALGQLAEVYWWWDSLPAVERTARRWIQAYPEDNWPWALLAGVGARTGDSTMAMINLRRYVATHPGPLPKGHELTVLLTLGRYEQVKEVVQPLLASSREEESNLGRWMLLIALRNQGRLQDAEQLLRTGRIVGSPIPAVPLRVDNLNEAILALEGGNPERAAAFFQAMRNTTTHQPAAGQQARWAAWTSVLRGTALAAAGDTAAIRMLADTVQYWGERTLFGRDRKAHHFLRGLLLAAEGKDEEAVVAYRAAIFSINFGYTRVNYELARALLRLGRPAEAIPVLQPALRGSIDASNLYITRTDLHELLARAFDLAGQPDSAAAHYRAVVEAWRRADPQFLPRRIAAETRLGHLASRPPRVRPSPRSAS